MARSRVVRATAIFPNNDIKCEVNKTRAQTYAAEMGLAITWSIAKDKPGNRVLANKINMEEEKEVWLTRHDRDCGDLYGTVPLVKGLPVRLTDHVDRDLALYKQTKCTIHGWSLNLNEVRFLLF